MVKLYNWEVFMFIIGWIYFFEFCGIVDGLGICFIVFL